MSAVQMCGGECVTYCENGEVVMNMHYGPTTKEVHRESIGERWCFACRKRSEFFYVVTASVEPSYYDPDPSIRCGNCRQVDGDCGFGRYREWE
jgi:hypothetical protein